MRFSVEVDIQFSYCNFLLVLSNLTYTEIQLMNGNLRTIISVFLRVQLFLLFVIMKYWPDSWLQFANLFSRVILPSLKTPLGGKSIKDA